MFQFLKKHKKEYPDFWKSYETSFAESLPYLASENLYVSFDTETTGLNPSKDRILSIGALKIHKGKIQANNCIDLYLKQEIFNPNTVAIHGILQNTATEKVSELEAIKLFLAYIGNSVLVGHHVYFDVKMINEALKRQDLPLLKNEMLDTGLLFRKTKVINYFLKNDGPVSLDDLCKEFSIDTKDRHKALGDAYITGIAFLKILSKLDKTSNMSLKALLKKNNL